MFYFNSYNKTEIWLITDIKIYLISSWKQQIFLFSYAVKAFLNPRIETLKLYPFLKLTYKKNACFYLKTSNYIT
jgi:hypothetical protein